MYRMRNQKRNKLGVNEKENWDKPFLSTIAWRDERIDEGDRKVPSGLMTFTT